jgi:hypothetical protein
LGSFSLDFKIYVFLPMTAGEFGTWTPIGAVQVAGGGYDIAWHDPSSGQDRADA